LITDQQTRIFDDLAGSYDQAFTQRLPGRWLRSMVRERIVGLLPSAARVLEIGCGTGEDALRFAELGHGVVATDISAAMLEQARQKLQKASPAIRERVQVEVLDAADPNAAGLNFEHEFDLVFSNFGALNCIADLRPIFGYALDRLAPGGYLAVTLMGRFCAWETVGFALRGDFKRMSRRWNGVSEWSRGESTQAVWYPTVGAVRRTAGPGFQLVAVYGVGALLPTTEFSGVCERWPDFFRRLARVENAIAGWWPINRLSDHFLIVLRKGPA
jgi:SAM-dependent methyltransferase